MAISLNEDLVPLQQADRFLKGRRHVSTFWRWSQKGVRGIVLETLVIGGQRFTSREALERFIRATTSAADRSGQSSSGRRHQIVVDSAIERKLDEAGFG